MKDRKAMALAREPRLLSLVFAREIPDDVITLNCDTRFFRIWGQVENNRQYLLPSEKKVLNMSNVSSKYLINAFDIFNFLCKLETISNGPLLICNNLESQNKKTFWCLKYIRFFRYKSDPTKFIVTDRAYNLLAPKLLENNSYAVSSKENTV
jgi:hypothetical protein